MLNTLPWCHATLLNPSRKVMTVRVAMLIRNGEWFARRKNCRVMLEDENIS